MKLLLKTLRMTPQEARTKFIDAYLQAESNMAWYILRRVRWMRKEVDRLLGEDGPEVRKYVADSYVRRRPLHS